MAPLGEVATATIAFDGPQGGPAVCGVLFASAGGADRAAAAAAIHTWWGAYRLILEPYIIAGTTFALERPIVWRDPVTAEIVADDNFPVEDRLGSGEDDSTNLSRACGLRMSGQSTERVNNRRVRTGWVWPYIGQSLIDANGQIDPPSPLSLAANLDFVTGAEGALWAAWHRPVYERDDDGVRVLKSPGVAYDAGRVLRTATYVSMLRSRRD